MATKLKKSKLYSFKTKAAAVAIILISALVASMSLVYVVDMRYESGFSYSSYFDTETFYSQYSQLVRDVVNTNLVFKNEENIKSGNALNEEKVIYNFALDNDLGEYIIYNSFSGLYSAESASSDEAENYITVKSLGTPEVKFSNPEDQACFDEKDEAVRILFEEYGLAQYCHAALCGGEIAAAL